MTAVMMSMLGVAPSYAVLAMLLVVVGASSASMHAVGPVMAGRLSGRNLGRGMGFWMVGGELGRTLGPIVIVTAIQLFSLESTPWLMIGGIIASGLLYVGLRDIPGPEVLVRDFLPERLAPMARWIEAISSSACTKAISFSFSARKCMISEAGVIG